MLRSGYFVSSYQYVDPLRLSVDIQSSSVRPQHHHVLPPQPPHLSLSICNKDLERGRHQSHLHIQHVRKKITPTQLRSGSSL